MAKDKDAFVVIAYRGGDNSKHSYTVGVFNDKDAAIKCADSHAAYRALKYVCVVEYCVINAFDNSCADYTEKVYRTPTRIISRII